jgi:hypothetical protein
VLKVAEGTETKQENVQDWFELDEGDPGFQLLKKERNYCSDIFIYFYQHCLFY